MHGLVSARQHEHVHWHLVNAAACWRAAGTQRQHWLNGYVVIIGGRRREHSHLAPIPRTKRTVDTSQHRVYAIPAHLRDAAYSMHGALHKQLVYSPSSPTYNALTRARW